MLSVIVPVYNEEQVLLCNAPYLEDVGKRAELIFVDGASSDASREICGRLGRVVYARRGRAAQMNAGARSAQTDGFLFLHADTRVAPAALAAVEEALDNGMIGGCLTQRIDNGAAVYRLIEAQGNLRARRDKIFYGDQGIFVSRRAFWENDGFPEVPLMEDVLFTRRLRRAGTTVVLTDPITVSARRWERDGILKTVLLYNLILFLFWARFPLSRIKGLYEDLR